MSLSRKVKTIISVGAIVGVLAITTPILTISLLNYNNTIKVTLLYNAGVMIESKGIRIYIDPITLPQNYSDLPADAVLITHPHEDHSQGVTISLVQKENTVNIFPETLTSQISQHNGIGVKPGDQFTVGHVTITAFYMYTFSLEGYPASHPQEENWTSYIIDFGGYRIFHAGDSKNIPEYSQLTGTIDIAMLPLGPGCQSMADQEVVDALYVIRPDYFIPIHYTSSSYSTFVLSYVDDIELINCEFIGLTNFEMHKFKK
ncbi:MAG: MBL fold metallo-hydrolase [Candidatus Thorarchaeota archaeon]